MPAAESAGLFGKSFNDLNPDDRSNKPYYFTKDLQESAVTTHAKPNGYTQYFRDEPGTYKGKQIIIFL